MRHTLCGVSYAFTKLCLGLIEDARKPNHRAINGHQVLLMSIKRQN